MAEECGPTTIALLVFVVILLLVGAYYMSSDTPDAKKSGFNDPVGSDYIGMPYPERQLYQGYPNATGSPSFQENQFTLDFIRGGQPMHYTPMFSNQAELKQAIASLIKIEAQTKLIYDQYGGKPSAEIIQMALPIKEQLTQQLDITQDLPGDLASLSSSALLAKGLAASLPAANLIADQVAVVAARIKDGSVDPTVLNRFAVYGALTTKPPPMESTRAEQISQLVSAQTGGASYTPDSDEATVASVSTVANVTKAIKTATSTALSALNKSKLIGGSTSAQDASNALSMSEQSKQSVTATSMAANLNQAAASAASAAKKSSQPAVSQALTLASQKYATSAAKLTLASKVSSPLTSNAVATSANQDASVADTLVKAAQTGNTPIITSALNAHAMMTTGSTATVLSHSVAAQTATNPQTVSAHLGAASAAASTAASAAAGTSGASLLANASTTYAKAASLASSGDLTSAKTLAKQADTSVAAS